MLPSMLISSQSELSTACQSHNAHLSVKTSIVSVNFLVSHRLPHILWNPSSCMLKQGCRASFVCSQHDAASICWSAPAPAEWCLQHTCSYPSITPARLALSSKAAGHRCCCWSMGPTDERTPDRYVDAAAHTMWAASITQWYKEHWTWV